MTTQQSSQEIANPMSGTRNEVGMKAYRVTLLALIGSLLAVSFWAPRVDAAIELADATGTALPGPTAFWAGTCDRSSAPAPGNPVPDGIGTMPLTVPDESGPVDLPAPSVPAHCLDPGVFSTNLSPSLHPSPWLTGPAWRLPSVTAAGARPDATAYFAFPAEHYPLSSPGFPSNQPMGNAKTAIVDVPAGVLGNPNAAEKCSLGDFGASPHRCQPAAQVGVTTLALLNCLAGNPCGGNTTDVYPVFNLEPRRGFTAEFGIPDIPGPPGADQPFNGGVSIRIFVKARTDGDFGVSAGTMAIPTQFPLIGQVLTFWGVPYSSVNDEWRSKGLGADRGTPIPANGEPVDNRAVYSPDWGPIRPFFANPSECAAQPPVTWLNVDSYQEPGALIPDGLTPDGRPNLGDPNWSRTGSEADPVTECSVPPFDPSAELVPTSMVADAGSGLDVNIDIPQNEQPPAGNDVYADDETGTPAHWSSAAGRATAQLDKTVVTLPEGLSVNPSAATGLDACSDDQMGVTAVGNPYLFNNAEPSCPDGSKIGTVQVATPLLDEVLTGELILGTPKSTDPQSGEMFRLFLVLRNRERGLLAKVRGTSVADPATGRLTATFDKNPRVPVENIQVQLKGGDRGVLATPPSCGTKTIDSQFTPWTASNGGGGPIREVTNTFAIIGRCGQGFVPDLTAGMDTQTARANGTFSFRFARKPGEQYLRGLTARLPQGLLASVKDVPLCSNAAADAGSCPMGSKIGIVDAKAGAGDPFVLEEKGEVFLTEGYKGGEYGLAVKVRAIAGPFRGAVELSPIIVRQAIHVDRTTAQVTAVSDPLPLIHHGVPLRVREVTVLVDRERFMLNPSDCSAKQVGADIVSDQATTANLANGFQASGCASLAFKPKLALRLTGRRQVTTGKHPGIRAVVTQQGVPEAGIEKAVVRLPKSLALDVNNAQALCEFIDGTKLDLENHCPKGSIAGRARAVSPLLNDPLVGNVYFVKNVRIDPKTGNQIRTLPMIVVALRGEISVNLRGESDTTRAGKLVNTFADVPDAPISRFNLNINGGSKGIISVTRTRRSLINLCASGRQIAEADMDGQNGRRHDFDVSMRKPCTRAQTRAAKRKAKRAAAGKRRAAMQRRNG